MENEKNEVKEPLEESSSDEEIENKEEPKPKRKQTEKQKENFRIAREKRMANIAKNNEMKNIKKQEEKAKIEAKIIKKGIAIKKKQIKKEKVLEMTQSDESASDYEIPAKVKLTRQRPPTIPERPQIYFI
jgi:hypothetical protein